MARDLTKEFPFQRILNNAYDSDGKYVYTSDVELDIAAGRVPSLSFVEKFGENPEIDTSGDLAAPADIWSYGGLYNFSTTADIDTISSSDAGDTQEMVVEGLDSNWEQVTQTATLDGQNKVTLSTPLIRCSRVYNGNSSETSGDVYVYVDGTVTGGIPDTAADVRALVKAEAQQTEMAIYTIPAGKTGYFLGGYVALSGKSNVNAVFTSRLRLDGGVFRVVSRIACLATGSSSWSYRYPQALPLPAKTDLLLRADSVSANDTACSGGFTIILEDA